MTQSEFGIWIRMVEEQIIENFWLVTVQLEAPRASPYSGHCLIQLVFSGDYGRLPRVAS